MFESEDWNFDEELLKDDKILQFCTQVENEEAEQPTKKRKLNECQDTNISTDRILNEPQGLTNNYKEEVNRADGNNASRTNFVLGIFQQNSQKKGDTNIEYKSQNIHNVSQTSSLKNISQNIVNSQMVNKCKLDNDASQQTSRKNIVLDILKKKNVQNQTDNSSKLSTSVSGIKSLHPSSQKTRNNEKSEVCHNAILQKSNSYLESTYTSSFFHNNEEVNVSSKIKNYNQKPTVSEEHHRKPEELAKKESKYLKQSINKNVDENKQITSQESRKRLLMQHLKPSTLSNEGFIHKPKPTSFTSKTEKQSTKKTMLVRKFPGPAGLLPDVIDNSLLSTLCLPNLEDSKADSVQDKANTSITEYCSQNTKTLFTEGAWQMMLDDIPPGLLENYEIAEIKEIASENQQECTKIPFLAGIIESIDYSHANPLIILKDFTGTIEGIIHADIPIKYPGALDKNVVILLQNVGLLCISGTFVVRKYHILISPANLLAVYSHKGDIIRTPQMELLKKESGMLESSSINLHTQDNQKEKLSPKNDHCNATFESLDESFNCDIDSDFQSKDNFNNSRLSIKEVSMKEEKENIHDNETSPLQISMDTPTKYHKELNCADKMENSNKKQNISIKSRLSAFKCKDVLTQIESNSKDTSENKSADKKMHWAEDILCNSDNDSDDEMLSQLDVDNMF